MKRILVTGGAGFIGSHLCERLVNEGHDVICLVMTCANPIGQKWMKSTIWLVQLRRFIISMTQYRPLRLVSSEHTTCWDWPAELSARYCKLPRVRSMVILPYIHSLKTIGEM